MHHALDLTLTKLLDLHTSALGGAPLDQLAVKFDGQAQINRARWEVPRVVDLSSLANLLGHKVANLL